MAYTVPRYIEVADLEQRVGARTIAQFFDDDGDGFADAATIDSFIAEASAYADSLLVASFGIQVLPLHAQDPRFKGAVADIAIGLAAERRPEFMRADGKFPYAERFARGKETLHALGVGWERLGTEATYGANPAAAGRVATRIPTEHVFAPSRVRPRRILMLGQKPARQQNSGCASNQSARF
jgi:hypothetical protein